MRSAHEERQKWKPMRIHGEEQVGQDCWEKVNKRVKAGNVDWMRQRADRE